MRPFAKRSWVALCLVPPALATAHAVAAEAEGAAAAPDAQPQIEEVVVTARKHKENLQSVPDAITAFTASSISNAGIEHIGDFAALTPNLTLQDGSAFRAGEFNLSMRGIGNGQEGWPSVSFLVDGVPADSTDSINSGSLEDIERIEVLRGPQSALYGFNAIAGAINVITREPTNTFTSEVRALYGNGADRQLGAVLSGPIIPDVLLFRLSADYRDDDGLIRSPGNGLDLDSKLQKQARARLLFKPADSLQIDLHASFDLEHNGSTYEDKVPSIAYADNFDPAYAARRAAPGIDDRKLYQISARIQWDAGPVSLVSVTSYSHIDQQINSSVCYDNPNDPVLPAPDGAAQCLLGAAYGNAAVRGQSIDEFFNSLDNFRTTTEDLRLQSHTAGPVEWIVGGSVLHRTALQGFDAGNLLAPGGTAQLIYPAWNGKTDNWWGLYGQLTWKITPRLELSAAGRYDDERYDNTTYTDRTQSTVVPVPSRSGTPIDTQHEKGNAFQPKGQISYHFTDDVMGYVTVSRGFRAGYFNTGAFTLPEHTTNYELGVKSTLLDRRLVMNAAAFHIDYSDQQFSTVVAQYPFRLAVTIPKTRIDGFEYESTAVLSRFLSVGLGAGFLDAKVADGTRSPAAPRFNANASVDLSYPLIHDWQARLHLDDRYNSLQFLETENQQPVGAKNFLNVRAGVRSDRYDIAGFVRNVTDRREATLAGVALGGGFVRYQNQPRSYGVEIKAYF